MPHPGCLLGAYGTLRGCAVGGHRPLDHQGQRTSAHKYNSNYAQDTTKTRNWPVSVDNEFLHKTLHNHAGGIHDTHPVSKACQHITSVVDPNISVRSSEREQRILAASRSVRWALLHRVRDRGWNCQSICADSVLCRTTSDQSFCDLHVRFQKLRDCSNMKYELALTCVPNGALTSPNGEVGAD